MTKRKGVYDYKSILAQELMTYDFATRIQRCLNEASDMKLSEFYEIEMKDYLDLGVKPKLFSHSFLISSLYVCVVLFKEEFYEQIDPRLTLREIEVYDLQVDEQSVKQLLRRMRNALSHGNIKIFEDYAIELYDVNPKKPDDEFFLKLTYQQVYDLTYKLEIFYAKSLSDGED